VKRLLIVLLIARCLFDSVSFVSADDIQLKDGRVIHGDVIATTRETITVRIVKDGMTVEMTINKEDIEEIYGARETEEERFLRLVNENPPTTYTDYIRTSERAKNLGFHGFEKEYWNKWWEAIQEWAKKKEYIKKCDSCGGKRYIDCANCDDGLIVHGECICVRALQLHVEVNQCEYTAIEECDVCGGDGEYWDTSRGTSAEDAKLKKCGKCHRTGRAKVKHECTWLPGGIKHSCWECRGHRKTYRFCGECRYGINPCRTCQGMAVLLTESGQREFDAGREPDLQPFDVNKGIYVRTKVVDAVRSRVAKRIKDSNYRFIHGYDIGDGYVVPWHDPNDPEWWKGDWFHDEQGRLRE